MPASTAALLTVFDMQLDAGETPVAVSRLRRPQGPNGPDLTRLRGSGDRHVTSTLAYRLPPPLATRQLERSRGATVEPRLLASAQLRSGRSEALRERRSDAERQVESFDPRPPPSCRRRIEPVHPRTSATRGRDPRCQQRGNRS